MSVRGCSQGGHFRFFASFQGFYAFVSNFRLVACLNSASAHTLNSDFRFKKSRFSVFHLAKIGNFRFPPNWEPPPLYSVYHDGKSRPPLGCRRNMDPLKNHFLYQATLSTGGNEILALGFLRTSVSHGGI